ncbi:hypothetical protein ONS95_013406 [Cadophora gregata]|uniref:uncharacterized protein n=1 Tax=Cadophora gregata TaxID=51156 RepID=UPI0026DC5AC4|nr:uncharacterized protein ONS95_013406 [Cadophora gregata]KAK0099701.1 hypothetical protein ONS96_008198 [Cadophora gregata f. sp. sojae]KAK0116386.1 hypothetical protein ONS95_013406 [Cadophora gregata]
MSCGRLEQDISINPSQSFGRTAVTACILFGVSMALRMGVGDAFTLCKSAVDLCSRAIHEEHEGAHTIVTEMKQVRAHLKCLEEQIGDEKVFAKARPDIAPVIKKSLEPLHRDLSDLKEALHACSGTRKPSIHVVDQVRYLVLYKAKLDGFREKLPAHRASISAMQELIDSQSPRERRESIVKLEGIVEEQEKVRARDVEYEKAQREVVKMFEKRSGVHLSGDSEQLNVGEMLQRLENDLVDKGMERKEAEQALFPITKALLRQPLPPAIERRSSAQKPDFKLDLFDLKEESGCLDKHRSGATSVDFRDNELVPPDDVDDVEDDEPTTYRLEDISSHGGENKISASPVAFLARRRPLLDNQMKSLDLILPHT